MSNPVLRHTLNSRRMQQAAALKSTPMRRVTAPTPIRPATPGAKKR